jgi:anti-sigma regulatory factor (Ser/Thr protein kinase)
MTPAGTADTLRWAVLNVPALPEHVRTARNLIATTLGDGHPCAADGILLASELVTNSVRHSDSKRPGGSVTITVWGDASSVLVEVTDAGGASVPAVHHGRDQEGGRGLFLVEQLSARWGYRADADGRRVTWFEVTGIPRGLPSGSLPVPVLH